MRFAVVVLLFFVCGCGMPEASYKASAERSYSPQQTSPQDSSGSMGWNNDSVAMKQNSDSDSETEATAQEDKNSKVPAINRKIIYTASLEVVVESFDGVVSEVSQLVNDLGGFISNANLGHMQGEQRSANWTVRIPVSSYHKFLNAVGNIGVPAARNEQANEVTEEFVDVQARIASKKKLEERILKLLEHPEHRIQQVMEVERELARVREDIERMEGRLRFLTDATSLATVSIHIREQQNYIPPQTPTFSNRVSSAWSTSLINCRQFFENLVVTIAGNAIGFGFFLLACLIAIPILRRVWKTVKPIVASKSRIASESN